MSQDKPGPPASSPAPDQPTALEQQVWELLEAAQEQVRPTIKREVESEPVTKELLNLRLKAHR